MDISKEYIKMCDCEEVQKQKHEDSIMQSDIIDKIKFEDGDYFYVIPCDMDIVNEEPFLVIMGREFNTIDKAFDNSIFSMNFTYGQDGDSNYCKSITWLPTQHQLQDLIYRLVCDFKVLQDFYYWAALTRRDHVERIKGRSLEQLWLQFYMWREHEKVWKDGEWVLYQDTADKGEFDDILRLTC